MLGGWVVKAGAECRSNHVIGSLCRRFSRALRCLRFTRSGAEYSDVSLGWSTVRTNIRCLVFPRTAKAQSVGNTTSSITVDLPEGNTFF